jgi:hypothetical protein
MPSQEPYHYKCHICSKSFTRSFTLRNHLNTHEGIKPFSCTVCTKRFTRDHDRKVHEKEKHTGATKYPCRSRLPNGEVWGCDSVFSRKPSLQRHLNSDIGRACRPPSNGPPPSASNLTQVSVEVLVDSLASEFYDASVIVPAATSARECGGTRVTDLDPGRGGLALNTTRSMITIPRYNLNHSQPIRDIEVILQQLNYIWHYAASDLPYRDKGSSMNVSILQIQNTQLRFSLAFTRGILKLDERMPRSLLLKPWEDLNAVCEMVENVLSQEPKGILRPLLSAFCTKQLAKFPDLRLHLLKYFASMARKVLTPEHPLAVILRLWQTEETLVNSAEPTFRLILDLNYAQTGAASNEILFFKGD